MKKPNYMILETIDKINQWLYLYIKARHSVLEVAVKPLEQFALVVYKEPKALQVLCKIEFFHKFIARGFDFFEGHYLRLMFSLKRKFRKDTGTNKQYRYFCLLS